MQLSQDQTSAFDAVMKWYKTKDKYFVLGGYAGTGKTTLAKEIAKEIGESGVIFCAYTGKAAFVLREKGCNNTGTIHSFLYKFVDEEGGQPHFGLNYESEMIEADLVIIDEFSMLPQEIIDDIHRLSKKVLYLGDTFQLPPVNGDCGLVPNFVMKEIQRQALESPIIRAATAVRLGNGLSHVNEGDFVYCYKKEIGRERFLAADQVIVGKNKTRREWNTKFLTYLEFNNPGPYCYGGEKIICLKNSRERGMFNGMIGKCVTGRPKNGNWMLTFECDGVTYENVPVWKGDFEGAEFKGIRLEKGIERFDFAYAITCHKSQGSEFDDVLIYNEAFGKDMTERNRWLYTAITRGKKTVTLMDPS